MKNLINVIEISSTQIRIAVGHIVDGKVDLVYQSERDIEGLISNAEIYDFQTLSSILSGMREYKDDITKEKYVINEATLILPSFGLNIFQSQKKTNVVSPYSIISNLDIENAISLVSKESVPNGSEMVDIIPDCFVLEMGRQYVYPPLNEKSDNLTINAKIHTLPTRIISDYRRILESARIKVNRICVSAYAISELVKTRKGDMPTTYFLIDVGADITNIALVGEGTLYEAVSFTSGGNKLIKKICSSFHIEKEEALATLQKYGLDERPLTFEPMIVKTTLNGEEVGYSQRDLNNLIKDFFTNEYAVEFENAFQNLTNGYPDKAKAIPAIFTGGLAKLKGFDQLAKNLLSNNNSIYILEPKCIGARDTKYSALIGAFHVFSEYKGTLSDTRIKPNDGNRKDE